MSRNFFNFPRTQPAGRFVHRPRSCGAFSLIEVVIALSVVALAVLTIVGMLSGALLNFGNAEQKAAFTQIHDQVLHDVQQLAWKAPGSSGLFNPTSPVYFDAQADELPTSDSAGVIYQATVTANTTSSLFANLLSASAVPQFVDSDGNPTMAAVTIYIYRYPGDTTGTPLNRFTDYVARYN